MAIFLTGCFSTVCAQENSPYSRYGLGDVLNNSNILNRGMGGIAAGFGSDRFLNPINPASYSFMGEYLGRFKYNGKLVSFDVGSEFNSRTLREQTPTAKYTSRNLYFNYMQLGMQISKRGNWGLNMGLMPVTRESYKIENRRREPGVDSIQNIFEGNGGVYQAFIGTARRFKNLSIGINTGYLFGKKESNTFVNLVNDTVLYNQSISSTRANYGSLFLQTGVIYSHKIKEKQYLKLGAYYHLKQDLRATQNVNRVLFGTINGSDTVFSKIGEKGTIVFPSTFGAGFTWEKEDKMLVGADFTTSQWSQFRYYGQRDLLQNSWMVKAGMQITPDISSNNYWNKVQYRAGFYYGKDPITAGGASMPVYAATFGISLPTVKPGYSRDAKLIMPAVINLALEAGRRGDNKVNLRENFVRVALSLSLSDIWFFKRNYQ
jgi:hypothetical protein